jgi:hypothetical protein
MGNQQFHRRIARGTGYMYWSVPGCAGTLRMPWSDILGPEGELDHDHLSTVLGALRQFEADVARLEENDTWPPLFESELADRVIVYKKRIAQTTGSTHG